MFVKLLKTGLCLAWALFLAWLLTYGKGELVRLLHPRLWWVLGAAIVVLILFLFTLLSPFRTKGNSTSLWVETTSLFILFIPFLYFYLAKDARLDETSLQNRIIQNDDGAYLNLLPTFGISGDSESEGMLFMKILRDPESYADTEVEVTCQSFVGDTLPENTAMCYRYMITCCAADALPAFIFLKHGEESIENNQWIKVRGPVSVIENNDMKFPSVEVEEINYVEEPDFPWIM